MKYLLPCLLLLTGCFRVGPNFSPPPAPIQSGWTEDLPVTDHEVGEWWLAFEDELLNDLIDFALQQNYNLEASAYNIVAARANLGFAIGEFFPQTQQAEGSLIRTRISANAPNTLNLIEREYWDGILGFRVAWELDFWGRFYRGVEAAYGEYMASQDDYLDVERLVISDIVLNYVQLKTLQVRIATLERNIAIQHRSVEITKVRFEEGFESELDYAQAVALWKETLAQKNELETEMKRVLTSLATLLGLTVEEFYCFFEIDESPLKIPYSASLIYPAEILMQRPDLRRSLDELLTQTALVGVAISDLLPRISLTGFIGFESTFHSKSVANQGGKQFLSRNSLTYFYGPDFVWPILNYGRLENRVLEQNAVLNSGIASYRNQVLVAYKEVEDALTFFIQSQEATDNLEESVKAAKRSVDISILQYQEGIADYTKVLNSLQLQLSAEDSLAQSQGNIGLAFASIYRALGVD